MKASSATSERGTPTPQATGRSSARPRPTRTAEAFALEGPSNPPDPDFNAYRKDLADIVLAGRVIASHYARPVERLLTHAAPLLSAPSDDADPVQELAPGETFALLDESIGWAWGYAGEKRRVGYVKSEALTPL